MHSDITKEKGRIDWWTVLLYLIFVMAGWLNIYAASFDLENAIGLFDLSGRAGMQLVWIGSSLVIAFAIMKIEPRFFDSFSMVFMSLALPYF